MALQRSCKILRAASKCTFTIYYYCCWLLTVAGLAVAVLCAAELFVCAKHFAIVRLKIIKFLIHVDDASRRQRCANYTCHAAAKDAANMHKGAIAARTGCSLRRALLLFPLFSLFPFCLCVVVAVAPLVLVLVRFHINTGIYVAIERKKRLGLQSLSQRRSLKQADRAARVAACSCS